MKRIPAQCIFNSRITSSLKEEVDGNDRVLRKALEREVKDGISFRVIADRDVCTDVDQETECFEMIAFRS